MADEQAVSENDGPPRTPDQGTRPRARRRWLLISAAVIVAMLGAATIVLGFSARSAYAELTASRDDLFAARDAVAGTDLTSAQASLDSAVGHAAAASDEVDSPLWDIAAALPWVGATPAAVQSVALALDQALAAIAPAGDQLAGLNPDSLVGPNGRIDLASLEAALPPMEAAGTGIALAQVTLADAPSRAAGDLVLPQVDDAAVELSAELARLGETLDTAVTAGAIAAPMLGADGPKRYFLAILNPNEARGTGGLLGQYAIIRADSGKITVEEVGTNADLLNLPATPPELGQQWIDRYDDGPRIMVNMNLSPHHPDAALLWLETWRAKTGEVLDGAISADVVALGDMVTATGVEVPLPDGDSLTGAQLAEFALTGVYEKFPGGGADSPARKAYSKAVTEGAIDVVTGATNRAALLTAMGTALSERRVQLWSADPATEQRILDAGVGGNLAVPDGHHVAFAAINSSGSKLDAYLDRSLTYTVGRCPAPDTGRVVSTVDITLTSAIPEGKPVSESISLLARRGPDGPINSTLAQVYLPMGASVLEVFVDGKSSEYQTFREQDRLAVLLALDLPPRKQRTVTVVFSEPADDGPGSAPAQPLANDQVTTIADRECGEGVPGGWDDEESDTQPLDPADDPLGPLVPLTEDEPADLSAD